MTGADGVDVAKPTLKDWWADGNTWGVKKLSARTKLTPVDDVAYPIYAGFLGLGDTAALDDVLLTAHVTPDDTFYKAFSGGLDRDEALTLFKEALRKTNNAIDVLYEQYICPLAFYVGATGLVPDNFGSAMTADQLMEKFPEVSLAQAEKEGTFYLVPGTDMILGVSVKAEHFSTERGVAAAKALPESAA